MFAVLALESEPIDPRL
ncbi:MAG: hypothetical protein U1E18_03155 [Brevundimonas sp.]|nr:hypothetical protein [Brevundimonas sp.]MDZ4108579.1 hypothetical protein [Brevundimonas sp.]